MDIQQPDSPPSLVVKPLLLDSLGTPFLAYVLGATEDQIEEWLLNESDSFGSEQQKHALEQLLAVFHNMPDNGEPMLRRLKLSRILGLYQEPFNTTLVNIVRMIATNEMLSAAAAETATPEVILEKLVRDTYPLYLLPKEPDNFPMAVPSLYEHPAREQFEAAVMADEQLAKLYPTEDEHLGRQSTVLRSTGQGGGVQLATFADTLIGSGWQMAEMTNLQTPSIDEHVHASLNQLHIIRGALAGKAVAVPVRIAFTGVLLHSPQPLDLGWGTLRPIDSRDTHLVPKAIQGELGGTRADGSSVTIDYSGNVVLDTAIEYRLLRQELDLAHEWPSEVRGYERMRRLIESVQLGALLSEHYDVVEPITVLPTWQYLHDPLAHGYTLAWSDPRMNRGFMPKQLSAAEEAEWCRFASAVEAHRTKYIDVAIRRTLRASSERKDFSDVLVDTVIAWENLVGSQQGEPTLRVSSSLARLLENEFSMRKKLRTELSGIYSTRSDIVHGNKQPAERELIDKSHRALEITVRTLRLLFTERLDLLKECKSGDERSIRLLMSD